MGPDTSTLVAAILNAAWMVRHYARGGRVSREHAHYELRQEAIKHLGIIVRDAFNQSTDYEALLTAVCDGLRPHDEQPF